MDIALYRRQLAETLARPPASYPLIVLISSLVGEHQLGGDVGVRLRKLHDLYCGTSGTLEDLLPELHALAALDDATLTAASRAKRLHADEGWLRPDLVEMHCSTCDDDGPPDDPDEPDAGLHVALYGPAYLLGWTQLRGAERKLLTLPLVLARDFDPKRAKALAKDAIELARVAYPTLTLAAGDLDYRSRVHFAWSLCRALHTHAAAFDRSLRAPTEGAVEKNKKKKKAVAAPDMEPMEELLLARTKKALAAWRKANPDAELAQLAFDGTPPHDNVGICFDTAANFAIVAAAHDAPLAASQARLGYDDWELAAGGEQWLDRFAASEFSDHYAAEVKLPKYARFAQSDDAPTPTRGLSWADGTLRVLFVRVLSRLVDDGALAEVPRAPLLYLGFSMHDERPVVVRTIGAHALG